MRPDNTCPICGSTVGDLPITILPERGMVVANGKFAILPSSEMNLLARMAEIYPRILSRESAMDWLYQLDPNSDVQIKIIDVFVCKLRKKLHPLGVRIDTTWGKGYALALKEKPRIVVEAVS